MYVCIIYSIDICSLVYLLNLQVAILIIRTDYIHKNLDASDVTILNTVQRNTGVCHTNVSNAKALLTAQ